MKKDCNLVLVGHAHVNDDQMSKDSITLMRCGAGINLDQTTEKRDGEIVENDIVIYTEDQARDLIYGIKAIAASYGWKL